MAPFECQRLGMNREIVVGFVKEHEKACLHSFFSQALKRRSDCSFCYQVNRDSLLLISRLREARKTVDVGLALSPVSKSEHYRPYQTAGFLFFHQKSGSESENINAIFEEAFEKGYDSVILIGHGTPNIPPAYLEEALLALRRGNEIILGPTTNSRFYLIGMTKSQFAALRDGGLFNELDFNTRWGRDTAIKKFMQTCSNCTVLPEWYSIKSLDDLRRLRADSSRGQAWNARWTTCHVNDIILPGGL
jgi:glycosyltransferase A (GT-A) superfamily protein (DUF2064 family)